MQLRNFARRVRPIIAVGLLLGLQTTFNPIAPVAAQRGDEPMVGAPIAPTSVRVINFADAARREASSPRVPESPVAIHSPVRVEEPAVAPRGPVAPRVAPNAQPRVASPSPSASFLAIADTNNVIPPDTMGAVGVDHLMTTINSQVRVQDRAGGVVSSIALSTFWSRSGVFDPRIIYDPFNARWIFVVVSGAQSASSSICIAISQTNLPTGAWNIYCLDVDSTNTLWADYPQVGFNKDWIVVSMNMFPISSGTSRGQIYAFNKPALYAGTFQAYYWNASSVPFPVTPAVTYDNSLAEENLVQHWSSASGLIRKYVITGSPPSTPTLTAGAFVTSILGAWSVPGSPSSQFLPQAGGATLIEIIDARMMNAVVRTVDGVTSLWCAQDIALPAGGSPTRIAAQWWQLDANASSATVYQQGRVEDSTATQFNGGYHYAYPSLAVNKYGDMLIGFSRFSSVEYASAAYAFRYTADAANTTRDPVLLKAGEGFYFKTFATGRNRWGDFSHTVVDPMSDVDMWTIQEYAAASAGTSDGDGRWAIWWGKVQLIFPTPAIYYFPDVQKTP